MFTDGAVVLHWLGEVSSTAIYPSLVAFKTVHVEGHDGTKIRWRDNCCFVCGCSLHHDDSKGCIQCGACWDQPADEIEPGGGHWVRAVELPPKAAEEPSTPQVPLTAESAS